MPRNLLVLVGAGSTPSISTRSVTEFLLQWRGAVEPGRDPKDLGAQPFFSWLKEQLVEVFPTSVDRFAPPVWSSSGDPNFEELLHIVERLTYLLHIHYYDMAYQRLPPFEKPFYGLSELGNALKKHMQPSLFHVLISACNAILDHITERMENERGEDSRLLMASLTDAFVPRVYSLNYDTNIAIESFDWWTGFGPPKASQKWYIEHAGGRHVFHAAAEPPARCPVFAQMHGSVNFGWIEHEDRPAHYVIARYPSPPMPHRAPPRVGFEHWNDRTSLPAMPMITGFRKAEKVLIEPYGSYYHYFRGEAFRCNRWLILGYGGGDPHVNAVLEAAADHWGSELRAYVCNYSDASVWKDSQEQYRYDVRIRAGFLGRALRGLGTANVSQNDTVTFENSIRMSVDGKYQSHADDVREFLE